MRSLTPIALLLLGCGGAPPATPTHAPLFVAEGVEVDPPLAEDEGAFVMVLEPTARGWAARYGDGPFRNLPLHLLPADRVVELRIVPPRDEGGRGPEGERLALSGVSRSLPVPR
jgi:hypothetical protein